MTRLDDETFDRLMPKEGELTEYRFAILCAEARRARSEAKGLREALEKTTESLDVWGHDEVCSKRAVGSGTACDCNIEYVLAMALAALAATGERE